MRMIFLGIAMLVLVSCQRSYYEIKGPLTQTETGIENEIIVPEAVALLVRPILDAHSEYITARRAGERTSERIMSELLYSLTENESSDADEALVVLTCFYIGESQEDSDEVISRGTKMLVYLGKYKNKSPIILGMDYPDLIRRRNNYGFEGTIMAIKQGRRGTWDGDG